MDPKPRRTIISCSASRYSQAQTLAQSKAISRPNPAKQQDQGIGQEKDSCSDSSIQPVQQQRPLFAQPDNCLWRRKISDCDIARHPRYDGIRKLRLVAHGYALRLGGLLLNHPLRWPLKKPSLLLHTNFIFKPE
jgi:hypothetical protein